MSLKISRKSHQNWDSKSAKNVIASLRHFLPRRHLNSFFLVVFFVGYWSSQGVSWAAFGSLRVSWKISGLKNIKKHCFFQVFYRYLFVSLKLKMALLVSFWFLLYICFGFCAKRLVHFVFQNGTFLFIFWSFWIMKKI